jgi:hypothetical protein
MVRIFEYPSAECGNVQMNPVQSVTRNSQKNFFWHLNRIISLHICQYVCVVSVYFVHNTTVASRQH